MAVVPLVQCPPGRATRPPCPPAVPLAGHEHLLMTAPIRVTPPAAQLPAAAHDTELTLADPLFRAPRLVTGAMPRTTIRYASPLTGRTVAESSADRAVFARSGRALADFQWRLSAQDASQPAARSAAGRYRSGTVASRAAISPESTRPALSSSETKFWSFSRSAHSFATQRSSLPRHQPVNCGLPPGRPCWRSPP